MTKHRKNLRERITQHVKRVFQVSYLLEQPMRLVDSLIIRFIQYSSYVLYYPYWLWRKKSIRNGIVWFAILSAIIAEFFTVAVLLSLLGMAAQFAMAAMYMVFQFAVMFIFLSSTKTVKLLPGDIGVKTFEKDWSDEDARKELEENFPDDLNAEMDLVCDDCYEPIILHRKKEQIIKKLNMSPVLAAMRHIK